MKHKILSVMSGTLVCLSLVFSSCGNIDNPLEEIVNSNPQVAVLADALKEGSEVTADFRMCGDMLAYFAALSNRDSRTRATGPDLSGYIDPETGEMPVKVVFKNQKGEFILKSFKINGQDVADNAETIAQEFSLDYKKVDNKLVFTINGIESTPGLSESAPELIHLSTVVFDLSDNSYAQYVYPNMTYVVLDKISVNSEDKTTLIENKYQKSAIFSMPFGVTTRGYAVREVSTAPTLLKVFCVFYKDGETWAEVNERYKKEAGSPLLKAYGDLTEEEKDGDEFVGIESFDGYKKIALLNYDGGFSMPFAYNDESTNEDTPNVVKTNEKVGYKADGETANSDGYLVKLRLIRRLLD